MCWQSKKLEARVSNGISVYKIMRPGTLGISAVPPFYYEFSYRRNKINPKVDIIPITSANLELHKITNGYHSYLNAPDIEGENHRYDLYRMEIPKGTIYYVDDENYTVVSENMIMRERLSYNHKMKIPFYAKVIHFFYDLFT